MNCKNADSYVNELIEKRREQKVRQEKQQLKSSLLCRMYVFLQNEDERELLDSTLYSLCIGSGPSEALVQVSSKPAEEIYFL